LDVLDPCYMIDWMVQLSLPVDSAEFQD